MGTRGRGARWAATVSALAVAASLGAVGPATGAGSGADRPFDHLSERAEAQVLPDQRGALPEGVQRLETSATVAEGAATPGPSAAPRKARLLRREGKLWMSSWNSGPPSSAQSVGTVDLLQDVPGKKVTVTAHFDATPTTARNSIVAVWFGTWDAEEETCTGRVWLFGVAASSAADDARALVVGGNESAGTARRSLSGSTLTVTWTGGRAGATNYSCVYASTYVDIETEDPVEVERSRADGFDPVYEMAPVFDFYSGALNAAYPKKWNKVYVNIRNEGDAAAKNVVLRGSGKKLKIRKPVKMGTIAAGKSKAVNLQVKLSGRATRKLNLKVTAAGNWGATSSTKVGFRPRPKKLKKLAGRAFWASPKKQYSGWNVQQLTFVNKKWVHQGVPKAGWPKKCTKKTQGCKRYTYKPGKKLLRIGKMNAKVDSEGIRTQGKNKVFYTPLTQPKANLRTAAKLSYYDYNGCEGSFSCSSWWRHLTLKKNGTFEWTYDAIHSSGIPPNETFVSISGPDKEGRYQFLSGGRLRINFVDEKTGKATTETYTVGIDQDELGRHAPAKGLLLNAMPHTP